MPTSDATTYSELAGKARRDRLVLDHLPLVRAIALRVHETLPVHVDLDDLVHAGILGLFDAAEKFDPEKAIAFQSYAKHRIKGAILDSLRQLDWASRDMRRRQKQIETVSRELSSRLGRTPTELEIAEAMGIGIERWRHILIELRTAGLVSANAHVPTAEETATPEYPAAPDSRPDNVCSRRQLRWVLDQAMSSLPERYQKVVFLYYTNEMTMKEIGDLMGVNESRISQIHKSALEKMAVALRGNGIHSSAAF